MQSMYWLVWSQARISPLNSTDDMPLNARQNEAHSPPMEDSMLHPVANWESFALD